MTPALAILLSALAMTLIVGVRYLVSSGAFAWVTRRKYPGLYRGLDPQIRREIGWSLASAAIYGAPAGVVAWGWANRGWTLIYRDLAAYPLWYLPVSVLAYLFAHDTWFYWSHRWLHRPGPFRLAHAVHHASRPPTAWAAMAFHPVEAVTGAVIIPLLVFIIPIHVGALGLVLGIMTVMGVTNHMGWEVFPRFMWTGGIGGWLITASHHQRHHDRYACNYGLYFRFWDRLFGTDAGVGIFAPPIHRLIAGTAAFLMLGAATPVAELEVDVTGLRSTQGELRLCLTARPDRFPSCTGDARAITRSVPAGQSVIRLGALPLGDWAVAVIHDANGNARLDTLLGIPREGFGFSNNPPIGFGAPRFAAARFRLDGNTVETVRMRYLL